MKKNAITRIILYSILSVVLIGVLIFGLSMRDRMMPSLHLGNGLSDYHGEVEEAHAGAVSAAKVRNIDIAWASGTITVQPGDTEEITFSETSDREPMAWYISEDTLVIEFQKKPLMFQTGRHRKDLTVTVPKDWVGEEISIDAASTQVELRDLTLGELEIDGTANRATLRNCTLEEISLDGASNNLDFEGSLIRLESAGASNHCTLALKNHPQEIELDGVSSQLDLTAPQDLGFTVEADGLSFDLDTDFEVTRHSKSDVTAGDGQCKIFVEGVSCDLTIRKAK